MSLKISEGNGTFVISITPKNGSIELNPEDEKKFNDYMNAYYDRSENEIDWISKHYQIAERAAQAIWYVSQRSRGTKSHIQRLLKAAKIPNFDWNSVFKGEEDEELTKFGL